MKYDLEERTFKFAKLVICLCKSIKQSAISTPIISQVVRSSNSCAANYIEADEAISKKDFIYRIRITRKETKETMLHLKLLRELYPSDKEHIESIIDESYQLIRIFSAIIKSSTK